MPRTASPADLLRTDIADTGLIADARDREPGRAGREHHVGHRSFLHCLLRVARAMPISSTPARAARAAADVIGASIAPSGSSGRTALHARPVVAGPRGAAARVD